tara:strand:- start:730 stop:1596 length:867 start_codon:yes stop_codon:yes gene_type:complete
MSKKSNKYCGPVKGSERKIKRIEPKFGGDTGITPTYINNNERIQDDIRSKANISGPGEEDKKPVLEDFITVTAPEEPVWTPDTQQPQQAEENFIRTYDNALPEHLVNFLLDLGGKQQVLEPRQRSNAAGLHLTDTAIPIEPFHTDIGKDIGAALLESCFEPYVNDFPCLQNMQWMSSVTSLQRTLPTQGYHSFHNENIAWDHNLRVMAWSVYLNDVEEGGETEFLYQKLRIKPKRNMGVVWPSSYTHLHRGNPPLSGVKYIITGWMSPAVGIKVWTPENKNTFARMDG